MFLRVDLDAHGRLTDDVQGASSDEGVDVELSAPRVLLNLEFLKP